MKIYIVETDSCKRADIEKLIWLKIIVTSIGRWSSIVFGITFGLKETELDALPSYNGIY